MKKVLPILLALALLFAFTACFDKANDDDKTTGNQQTTEPQTETPIPAAGQIVLVVDWNGQDDEGRKEYLYDCDYPENEGPSVMDMAAGLSDLTGLDFTIAKVSAPTGKPGMLIDWAPTSYLVGGLGDREQKEDFFFFDYDSMAWFMMDSLYQTILKNIPDVEEVWYTMDGGKALVLENLSPPRNFTLDTPYMGRAFYEAHDGGRGDDIPVDPADVSWSGTYTSDVGLLNIVNYNGRSFRFTFDNVNDRVEGVAAVDQEHPVLAEYGEFSFIFNLDEDAIDIVGGDFTGYYTRMEEAMG